MMKIKVRKHTAERKANRLKKKIRIRKTVMGTEERPRLVVFRSSNHMYAQIVNDITGNTLASASSLKKKEAMKGMDQAKFVGLEVAKAALSKNIKSVVFDRNGFIYHGRVKALADAAREGGLSF
jgi:large subunit ribosomal protein L18